MYVAMNDLLQDAHKNNYAVMAVNSINMEMVRAVISAAEEERSPIIINIGPGQMKKHADPEIMVPMIKKLAHHAKVPVALNLDHGSDLDFIIKCIQLGFSSVMIDASSFEFEENIKRCSIISALAHAHNITVEGELGHVGQANAGDNHQIDLYTNPEQAKEFVERTGIDALAVAIGTAHGNYPKEFIPKLDFERLALLKKTLDMPLVLHGGSGSGPENIKKAVANGINKINVCTDAFTAGKTAMVKAMEANPNIDYLDLNIAAEAGMKQFVRDYIQLIGSKDRYYYGEVKVVEHE